MQRKIFSGLLGIVSFLFAANFASASQIPAGYVLVPAETFFSQNIELTVSPAAEISISKSSVRVNDEISYVGESSSVIITTLRDERGNPISGQKVNLISSRQTDTIKTSRAATNKNGEAIFQVIASEEGVSSFTAVTENQTLAERPRVVFLQQTGGIGGNLLSADVAVLETPTLDPVVPDPAVVSIITTDLNQIAVDFPERVAVDIPADITINIQDEDGNLLDNFDGTISFKSTDSLAILPRDYTFTELDRSSHTFANAVTFATAGNQTIDIFGDTSVAEKQFPVKVLGNVAALEAPVITNPSSGALLNDTVSFFGFAEANSNLAVFVDGQFSAKGESDTTGRFFIDVDLLDGQHEISVAILNTDNSVGAISETISVDVDQTPPMIEEITVSPGNKVGTGTLLTVSVKSEVGLENAQFTVNNNFVKLKEDEEVGGIYSGEITAPTPGTYLIGVELVDAHGNTGGHPEATSLLVETAVTIEEIETVPQDGRINLRWNPPANNAEVLNYEIFYGTDSENLKQKFTTPDNRTTWYVDDLNNNTNYFFQVVSLNLLGEQNGGSRTINATPVAILTTTSCDGKILLNWQADENEQVTGYRLDYGVASGNYAESRVLSGGTASKAWEVRDLVNEANYFFALRGIDDFGEIVANIGEEVSATPHAGKNCAVTDETIQLQQYKDSDGNTVLLWDPVMGADGYRVYAGTQPNLFDLPAIEINSTSFRPEGLSVNHDYFFAVSAVFAGDHGAATLSNVAKVEVGPAEILLISLLVALVGSFVLHRKNT